VPLATIVATHSALSATRSRKAKVALLADCLSRLTRHEVGTGVAYLGGELPQGRIGLGPALLDALEVPAASTSTLRLEDIDTSFSRIAGISGAGAKQARLSELAALFAAATADEQRYLRALLLGALRQGALEALLVEALALSTRLPVVDVRRAVMLSGNIGTVAERARLEGATGLASFRLTLFQPVQAMLAQPADNTTDAISLLGAAALEFKLDGARIQVHRDGDEVHIYTRQLHEVTDRAPEIVEAVRALPCDRVILDGEAIAFDSNSRPLPFQTTMQRFGRREADDLTRQRIPLSARFFDMLLLDGEELLDSTAAGRDRAMRSVLPHEICVEREVTSHAEEADRFLRRAIAAGHEGIMAKSLDASYRAGNRGADWLKIKPVHTLDLVILAAEWGSGRRSGRLSNLHLGARNDQEGGFIMLGKTFKGLTDQLLKWQTQALLEREIGREDNIVHVRPELVVEIAFNELQRSSQYPAGLALRFARVKRYRTDKSANQADTLSTVQQVFQQGFAAPAA
jgi:DNA ligase-1